MDDLPLIFLSYASPDQDRVDEFYQKLKVEGFNPWMDKYELRGGQNWDLEIKRAMRKAAIIVVFLSYNSVNKRGYCQREIKVALDIAQEKMYDDIYIIPVMLDHDVPIPEQLGGIQVIKSNNTNAFAELCRSISGQLKEYENIQINKEGVTGLSWSLEAISEQWEGLPGYEFKYDIIRVLSDKFKEVSKITDILRGDATEQLLSERRIKFEQEPQHFNFGQARFSRQNVTEVSCRAPIVTERVLSIVQEIYSYGAGAAHPNHGFATMNFMVDPLIRFDRIQEIFQDDENAFSVIQKRVRQLLSAIKDGEAQLLDDQWLIEGTSNWDQFQNFAFTAEGLLILFGPYEVGPYAAGTHSAVVPYAEVVKLMKLEIAAALGLEYAARYG